MPEKVRVGVIGCGAVSGQYFKTAASFPILEIAALADLIPQRCESRREEFNLAGARICTDEQLLADKSIEVVLNLTWPSAHFSLTLDVIRAGKHVFSEKPLGIALAEGKRLMSAAGKRGLRVGCAPDTVLGSGIQTARKLVDDGAIGRPVAFTAFMLSRGVETWHPNPPFYYEPGGGPMLDMGPYYLSALMTVLGPIRRISGAASIAIPRRLITHKDKEGKPGPLYGRTIEVTTPDHVCGTIEFASGCAGVIMTSFAACHGTYDVKQPITIYGTEGTLKAPDPNCFDGPVHVRRCEDAEWRMEAPAFPTGYGRAVGLADMCYAIRTGRKHRAGGAQALAALECMEGFLQSAAKGSAITPKITYERPAPMPADLPFGVLDE